MGLVSFVGIMTLVIVTLMLVAFVVVVALVVVVAFVVITVTFMVVIVAVSFVIVTLVVVIVSVSFVIVAVVVASKTSETCSESTEIPGKSVKSSYESTGLANLSDVMCVACLTNIVIIQHKHEIETDSVFAGQLTIFLGIGQDRGSKSYQDQQRLNRKIFQTHITLFDFIMSSTSSDFFSIQSSDIL